MDPLSDDPSPDAQLERRSFAYYDRLRERIRRAVERRSDRWGAGVAEALLLAPDLFLLLLRMVFDRGVPRDTRRLLGGALLYFLLPIDLLPEALVGVVGLVDDVVLAAVVLDQVFEPALATRIERNWSGGGAARQRITDLVRGAAGLLGQDLYGRLRNLLLRRGGAAGR